jgi:hypothetical protein
MEMNIRGISIPDRDEHLLFQARGVIGDNFLTITDEIEEDYQKNTPLEEVAEQFRLNWMGLNNICRLTMDEITYLSGRVDTLQSYLNTYKSLRYAVWGVLTSAALSFCSIIVSILLNDAGKDNIPQRSNAAMYLELGKERERLSEMAREESGISVASSKINERLDALTHDLTFANGGREKLSQIGQSPSPR